MAYHVYIATTCGPLRVKKIQAQDAEFRPVLMYDSTKVSRRQKDYIDFVETRIQFRHKHRAFVADLDAENDIDNGESWQLGLLLAHEIEAERERGRGEGLIRTAIGLGDTVILATGEVDSELEVRAVGDVPEKLEQAAHLLDAARRAGARVLLLVPRANSAEGPPEDALGLEWLPVGHFREVLAALPELEPVAQLPDGPVPPKRNRESDPEPWPLRAAVAAFLLVVTCLAVWWLASGPGPDIDDFGADGPFGPDAAEPGPPAETVRLPAGAPLGLVAHYGRSFADCDQTVDEKLLARMGDRFESTSMILLCGLELRLAAGSETQASVAALWFDRAQRARLTRSETGWSLPLPAKRNAARDLLLVVVQAVETRRLERWLDRWLEAPEGSGLPQDRLESALRSEGWTAAVFSHRMEPF